MSSRVHLTATINGEEVEFLADPGQSLLEVLRDELGLTGTKEGCSNGNCGACTVLLDGEIVDSCIVLAPEVQNRDVVTIEGVADRGELHQLQRQFLEHAALQCGICTPGFIVASKGLLDRNPSPTEHEIRSWLAGNLCRCTGYDKIIKAVQAASAAG
jgi:carbon-monoxide dehydrogenase small subunit